MRQLQNEKKKGIFKKREGIPKKKRTKNRTRDLALRDPNKKGTLILGISLLSPALLLAIFHRSISALTFYLLHSHFQYPATPFVMPSFASLSILPSAPQASTPWQPISFQPIYNHELKPTEDNSLDRLAASLGIPHVLKRSDSCDMSAPAPGYNTRQNGTPYIAFDSLPFLDSFESSGTYTPIENNYLECTNVRFVSASGPLEGECHYWYQADITIKVKNREPIDFSYDSRQPSAGNTIAISFENSMPALLTVANPSSVYFPMTDEDAESVQTVLDEFQTFINDQQVAKKQAHHRYLLTKVLPGVVVPFGVILLGVSGCLLRAYIHKHERSQHIEMNRFR